MVLSPEKLADEIAGLASGRFLQNAGVLLSEAAELLTPPEDISTVDCAERFRKLPGKEDGAIARYDRMRTPYNVGPMNSLDDPECHLMVMVKPSRSGGTTVAENFLFKMIRFGPMAHVSWVLNTDEAVEAYCRTVVKPMFDLNDDLRAEIDEGRGNNTDGFKRIRGYPVEWLSAKDSTFRNREPWFMVADETDAWTKRYARSPKVQIDGRQKQLGNRRKGAIMSHADLGWTSGVAAAYEDTSRGIYVMRCAECGAHAAAYAPKFWSGVPMFRLDWTKSDSADADDRLELAERTARMHCPHCGVGLTDEQRRRMVDEAMTDPRCGRDGWMHRGQTLDAVEGVLGDVLAHRVHGYWVHGLMLKAETLAHLAREYEAALIDYERTRDPDKLREFLSKQLGEVFEGKAGIQGVNAASLRQRSKDEGMELGVFPADAAFVTAAVDIATSEKHARFDVSFYAWDLECRSWWLDRLALRQRLWPDGKLRDVAPEDRIDDWDVLVDEVILRRFPMEDRPGWFMPLAQVAIDVGDGNVTGNGREFAARCIRNGLFWGTRRKPYGIVQLIRGSKTTTAPILPPRPSLEDSKGRRFPLGVREWQIGVHRGKELALERLAVTDGGPGQCFFADGISKNHFAEFFNEPLIDGKFVRQGPNESLDLFGYAEAARQMLKPEKEDRLWNQACMPQGRDWHEGLLPPWARPIPPRVAADRERPEQAPKTISQSPWSRLTTAGRQA